FGERRLGLSFMSNRYDADAALARRPRDFSPHHAIARDHSEPRRHGRRLLAAASDHAALRAGNKIDQAPHFRNASMALDYFAHRVVAQQLTIEKLPKRVFKRRDRRRTKAAPLQA